MTNYEKHFYAMERAKEKALLFTGTMTEFWKRQENYQREVLEKMTLEQAGEKE